MNRKLGHKVSPRKKADIEAIARNIRDKFGLTKCRINIVALYEILQSFGLFEFEVVEDAVLGDIEAETIPSENMIRVKRSIYDKACDGDGHCRFTMAHELGHFFLHSNQTPAAYARGQAPQHKVYEDSEWQADVFASEFLIDSRYVNEDSDPYEVSILFGVSLQAAQMKIHKIKNGRMN
ncbi:ImmA/IrrE family metallo-endopeptidase [Rheinheimera pleomorphica]|uniref:ImmA/IrrE family metallo-endopeptidase n=1 Tax=Rheinheimera pleomorphica TaxID=2703963 RepID=UPI0014216732|nr:ImmA/IrrE family metallo-endopeptidase [Rheinheimera pleomorphica]